MCIRDRHYAVHGNTAAEVIVARADHNREHMGLKSWKNAPNGKIVKTDAVSYTHLIFHWKPSKRGANQIIKQT